MARSLLSTTLFPSHMMLKFPPNNSPEIWLSSLCFSGREFTSVIYNSYLEMASISVLHLVCSRNLSPFSLCYQTLSRDAEQLQNVSSQLGNPKAAVFKL